MCDRPHLRLPEFPDSPSRAQPPKRRQPVAVPGSVRTELDNGLGWAPMFSGLVLGAGSSYLTAADRTEACLCGEPSTFVATILVFPASFATARGTCSARYTFSKLPTSKGRG